MFKNDYSGGQSSTHHLLYNHSASALESPAIEIIQGTFTILINI